MEDRDDALSDAASTLGTTTEQDTVNAALFEVAKRRRRLIALEELATMGERGDFDILLDKGSYRSTWPRA
ncbi:DUF2191 domain-containing protein [Streptomyces sp. NPDC002994]|uniref:DUF2191 domain-containing protein n=1 Tax=Streptomyces sp. NPDC002994 TaxID=3154441 RepID=UPI0033AD57C3